MARWWYGYIGGTGAVGLLVLRLVAGAAFILHGWPKIQNPLGWMGPDAPVPPALQAAAAVAEFGGGIAWVLGALTPLFSLLIAGTMAYATSMVHVKMGHPFVIVNQPGQPYQPSIELAAVYLAVAILFLLVGPGKLSLDYCLFGRPRSVVR
jgi:putative oxidoreductase